MFPSSVVLTGKAFQREQGDIDRSMPSSQQPKPAASCARSLAPSGKPNDKTKDESQF